MSDNTINLKGKISKVSPWTRGSGAFADLLLENNEGSFNPLHKINLSIQGNANISEGNIVRIKGDVSFRDGNYQGKDYAKIQVAVKDLQVLNQQASMLNDNQDIPF